MVLRSTILIIWLALSLIPLRAMAQAGSLVRTAEAYCRTRLAHPYDEARVKSSRNLAGGGCCVNGWFEYDFDIGTTGWYGPWIHGQTTGIEYFGDPDRNGRTAPEAHFVHGTARSFGRSLRA
jgi:hypothetical protein